VADLDGNVLGFARSEGAHPNKNHTPGDNVRSAILDALEDAATSVEAVRYTVGGFAGVNAPEDQTWARQFLADSGLEENMQVHNDAVVAQFGAFLGGPGIMAVSGTGSIVVGKTESGRIVRNYDFHHEEEASARFLSYSVIYDLITRDAGPENRALLEGVLEFWDLQTVDDLRNLAACGFGNDRIEARNRLSEMGELVTAEAASGTPIAVHACGKVIDTLGTGIGLVSAVFSSEVVPLALVGGVARNPFTQNLIHQYLDDGKTNKSYLYQQPKLSPVLGAVLYALREVKGHAPEDVVERLLVSEMDYDFY
jgi:glucosamine kinase